MEIISKVVGSLYPFQNQRWRLHRSDPMNKLSPTQNTPALQATLALPPQLVELKKNRLNCHDKITLSGEIIVIGLTFTHRIFEKVPNS